MTIWTLPLPWDRPPLSLNDRHHWAQAARKKKDIRNAIIVLARANKLPAADTLTVTLVWQPPDRRRRDTDNPMATTKVCVDGLVQAGIVPDDHAGIVTHQPTRILPPDPGQKTGRLWLELDYHRDLTPADPR